MQLESIEPTTEQRILKAAEEVFLQDGFDGARMQAIADKAEINKAMLHYYFRSKETLFERIFDEKVTLFFPKMGEVVALDLSFTEKICLFIERYMALLCEYPFLPLFVINTVNKPDKQDFIKKLPIAIFQSLSKSYMDDLQAGKIRSVNPMQLMISVIGMCAFPFLAKPVIEKTFNLQNDDFQNIMKQRIEEIQQYIRLILTP